MPAFDIPLDDRSCEVARAEAVVEAGDPADVGEFLGAAAEGDGVVTARFAATVEGYDGWQWSVTVALIDPSHPTVSEVVLLPGPDALLAPAWVPWKERVQGGDLGVGDLLPPAPDDARIVPAYVQSDDPAVEEVAREIGLGRVRVLSREGRLEAAERWHRSEFGPGDEMALHAPGTCVTCAFFVPLAGALGAGFGVCTNAYSPADAHVVDVAFGCGAHSEATVKRASAAAIGDVIVDELSLEVHQREVDEGADIADDADESVDITDDADEGADTTDDADERGHAADVDEAVHTGDATETVGGDSA